MAQKPIELILLRELAGQLAMPVTIADADGNVVFFNRPAERLYGFRFDEVGELPYARLRAMFNPVDAEGTPIPLESMPLGVALLQRRPKQGRMTIHEADGTPHLITITSVPLEGQGGLNIGAMAIFWELDSAPLAPAPS